MLARITRYIERPKSRKATLNQKMKENQQQILPTKADETHQQVVLESKAVQTEDIEGKELRGKIAALEEIVRQQGEILQQIHRPRESDKEAS